MSLLLFLISLLGNVSALRILSAFRDRALIARNTLTKIGIATAMIMILILIIAQRSPLTSVVAIILTLFSMSVLVSAIEQNQIQKLKREFPHFLDRWILNVKLGHSLFAARDAALRSSDAKLRALLEPWLRTENPNEKSHFFVDEISRRELRAIHQSAHSGLSRLENLRAHLRDSDDFRRKSGQALRQSQLQSGILLFLQFALMVFTVFRYGWSRSGDLVTVAAGLSFAAMLCMRTIARKKTWKI